MQGRETPYLSLSKISMIKKKKCRKCVLNSYFHLRLDYGGLRAIFSVPMQSVTLTAGPRPEASENSLGK